MTLNATLVLWLLLLAFVTAHLIPKPVGWGKTALYAALVLLTVVLVLLHGLAFK